MNLFIGCTAKENIDKVYIDECSDLIKMIASIDGVNLVYGAFNKGLMKTRYSEFKKNNKQIVGVITEHDDSLGEDVGSEKIIVASPIERINKIYSKSDAVLILPGGLGTMAELFSAIDEVRYGDKKKIILYNCNFFYTSLIKELYHLYELGFIDLKPYEYMIIESDKNKIIEIIEEIVNYGKINNG